MRRMMLIKTVLILCLLAMQNGFAQKVYDSRDEIPNEYKWDLSDIYESWDTWEEGLKELETKMDEIIAYKGKLKESAENLLKVQKLDDELGVLAYKVYRYPKLTSDTDTREQEVKSKLQKVQILFAKYNTAVSWIEPEILEVPWETMKEWLDSDPEFQAYRFGIEDLYRQQAHVLDEEKEKLLSLDEIPEISSLKFVSLNNSFFIGKNISSYTNFSDSKKPK